MPLDIFILTDAGLLFQDGIWAFEYTLYGCRVICCFDRDECPASSTNAVGEQERIQWTDWEAVWRMFRSQSYRTSFCGWCGWSGHWSPAVFFMFSLNTDSLKGSAEKTCSDLNIWQNIHIGFIYWKRPEFSPLRLSGLQIFRDIAFTSRKTSFTTYKREPCK